MPIPGSGAEADDVRCEKPSPSQVANDQQKIADAFFKLGLIPKAIKISDAVLPDVVSASKQGIVHGEPSCRRTQGM